MIRDRATFRYDNAAVITPTPIASAMSSPMINDGMGVEPRPTPPETIDLSCRGGDGIPLSPAMRPVEYPTFAKPERTHVPMRLHSSEDTHGFIYIIMHPIQYVQAGVLKIGYTDDLKERLRAANTWSFSRSFEYALYLPVSDKKMAEDEIHEVFSDVRQGDTEWFEVDLPQAKIWLQLVADSFQLEARQLEVFTA